jgi:hypothetical protein
VVKAADPELSADTRQLFAYLVRVSGAQVSAERWAYRCSVPSRRDDGSIAYFHAFADGRGCASFAVAASPEWWPADYQALAPAERTPRRGALRLV